MSNINGNSNEEIHLQKRSSCDSLKIAAMEDEIQLLHEQIATFQQELRCQWDLIESYCQELKHVESEQRETYKELCNAYMVGRLELDEAKELASSIVNNNKSVRESLAQLLSAIYNSPVKTSDLCRIDRSRLTILCGELEAPKAV